MWQSAIISSNVSQRSRKCCGSTEKSDPSKNENRMQPFPLWLQNICQKNLDMMFGPSEDLLAVLIFMSRQGYNHHMTQWIKVSKGCTHHEWIPHLFIKSVHASAAVLWSVTTLTLLPCDSRWTGQVSTCRSFSDSLLTPTGPNWLRYFCVCVCVCDEFIYQTITLSSI